MEIHPSNFNFDSVQTPWKMRISTRLWNGSNQMEGLLICKPWVLQNFQEVDAERLRCVTFRYVALSILISVADGDFVSSF